MMRYEKPNVILVEKPREACSMEEIDIHEKHFSAIDRFPYRQGGWNDFRDRFGYRGKRHWRDRRRDERDWGFRRERGRFFDNKKYKFVFGILNLVSQGAVAAPTEGTHTGNIRKYITSITKPAVGDLTITFFSDVIGGEITLGSNSFTANYPSPVFSFADVMLTNNTGFDTATNSYQISFALILKRRRRERKQRKECDSSCSDSSDSE